MTDEGFELTNQLSIVRGSRLYEYSVVWLSDLVGGLWLVLGHDPGLLWARLGEVAIEGICASLVCWVLAGVFRPMAAAAAVIAAAALIHTNPPSCMGYNSVPMMIMLGGVVLAIRSREASDPSYVFSFLGGACFGLAAMAKLPSVVALGLPVILVAVRWWFGRIPSVADVAWSVSFWFGSVASICGCLLVLWSNGRFGEYLSIFGGKAAFATDEAHSLRVLLPQYGTEILQTCSVMLLLVGVACAFASCAIASSQTRHRVMGVGSRVWALTSVCLVLGGATAAYLLRTPIDHRIGLVAFAACGTVGVLAAERYMRTFDDRRIEVVELLVCGVVAAMAATAGTATLVGTLKDQLILLLPTILLLVGRNLRSTRPPMMARLSAGSTAGWFVVAIVVASSVVARGFAPYQDVRNPLSRNVAIKSPRLAHIVTSLPRAQSVDELFSELEGLVRPGDPLLAYGELCMVNYVTRTEPILGHAWPNALGQQILEQRLRELGSARALPVVAVRSRVDMRSRQWGTSAMAPPVDRGGKMHQIDIALRKLGYHTVWENREFEILAADRFSNAAASGEVNGLGK